MIYVSAIYANSDHSMVTGTDANGATETVPANHTVFRQPEHGPAGFVNNGGTIQPYVAPPAPALTRLYKSTFIRRMMPAEADTLEGVLLSEAAYLRMLYHSVEYFEMDDALVGYLHMVLTDALSEARANELLAPEG